jgi:hypothetical protein
LVKKLNHVLVTNIEFKELRKAWRERKKAAAAAAAAKIRAKVVGANGEDGNLDGGARRATPPPIQRPSTAAADFYSQSPRRDATLSTSANIPARWSTTAAGPATKATKATKAVTATSPPSALASASGRNYAIPSVLQQPQSVFAHVAPPPQIFEPNHQPQFNFDPHAISPGSSQGTLQQLLQNHQNQHQIQLSQRHHQPPTWAFGTTTLDYLAYPSSTSVDSSSMRPTTAPASAVSYPSYYYQPAPPPIKSPVAIQHLQNNLPSPPPPVPRTQSLGHIHQSYPRHPPTSMYSGLLDRRASLPTTASTFPYSSSVAGDGFDAIQEEGYGGLHSGMTFSITNELINDGGDDARQS